jgi:exopolysaccharide biosynthesis polyprenyl glycosylphosphotransferase
VLAPPATAATSPLQQEQMAIDASAGSGRTALLKRGLCVADVLAALVAGSLAALAGGLPALAGAGWVAAVTALWFGLTFAAGLYAVDTLGVWASGVPQLGRLAAMALLASWPLVGLGVLAGAERPETAAWIGSALLLACTAAARTVARAALHRAAPLRQRTVIVGSGVVAGQLVDRLRRHHDLGLDVIGIVDDDVHDTGADAPRLLGRLSELRTVLTAHHVHRVVIAFSRAGHEDLLDALRACREQRVAVDVVPRLFEFLDGVRSVEQVGGLPLLSIGSPRLSRSSAFAKRALDVVVSATALVVLAPLLALVAAAIRLETPGPALFRQRRAGRGGEPFEVVKFRSMHDGADARKAQLAERNEAADDVMFKIRRDPRITRLGAFLRRTSIDELPQLINVLKGEMSLVGPRPLVFDESDALAETWHARRLDLRPGMTGPWQVSGRSDLSVHDMVRLDFQYVTGWSLGRDLEILVTTVPAVLGARGAY